MKPCSLSTQKAKQSRRISHDHGIIHCPCVITVLHKLIIHTIQNTMNMVGIIWLAWAITLFFALLNIFHPVFGMVNQFHALKYFFHECEAWWLYKFLEPSLSGLGYLNFLVIPIAFLKKKKSLELPSYIIVSRCMTSHSTGRGVVISCFGHLVNPLIPGLTVPSKVPLYPHTIDPGETLQVAVAKYLGH